MFLTSPTVTIFRLRAGRRQPRRREADQLDELAEILRDRRERAFVARAGHATQTETAEIEIALQMREQHLDLPAFASRLFERSSGRETGDMLAHLFMRADGQ